MISVFFVISFLFSLCLTYLLMSPSSRLRMMDLPNERSLHSVPVSRAGGVAILVAFFVGTGLMALLLDLVVNPVLLLSILLVAGISFLDDCYSLGAALRFFVHFCTALLLVMNGYSLDVLELPGWIWQWNEFVALAVSCVFIVWLINLYNFMDGMDGFSAGMAAAGFSCFSVLGWQSQDLLFMSVNLMVVSAVVGFLCFNFPPAKIFMGDTGASTLGLLVAAFSLWAGVEGIFPIWVAILVFSPFIVDASVTLLHRLLKGEKVWKAHRRHFYQRLVQVGWGHKKTVLYSYILMIACGVSALLAVQVSVEYQLMILIGWLIGYVVIMIMVSKLEYKNVQS